MKRVDGVEPCAVLCELMNPDGTMVRPMPDLPDIRFFRYLYRTQDAVRHSQA